MRPQKVIKMIDQIDRQPDDTNMNLGGIYLYLLTSVLAQGRYVNLTTQNICNIFDFFRNNVVEV